MSVLGLSLKLVLLIAVGFTVKKLRVLPKGFEETLSRLLLNVSLPAIIIKTFIGDEAALALRDVWFLLASAVALILLSLLLGQLLYLLRGRGNAGKVDRLGIVVTNFTFFGIPVVETLYGAPGLLYFTIFTIPIRLVYYMASPLLLVGKGSGVRDTLKNLISAPVISIGIGAILYFTGLRLPAPVADTVTSLAATATPLGLMLCGATLTEVDFKALIKRPVVLVSVAARLLIVPAIVLGLSLLLRLPAHIVQCMVIYSALPCASMIPTYVLRYLPDDTESHVTGGLLVLLTTLLCVLTIPLWAALLARFY